MNREVLPSLIEGENPHQITSFGGERSSPVGRVISCRNHIGIRGVLDFGVSKIIFFKVF